MATAPILAHELATVLRPPVPKIVLVDLSGVTFLDSTGIGVLIDVHKLARASAAHLRICGANRAVTRALQLTGVTNVLEIFDSRTAARLTSSPAGLPKQARRRFRGGPTQPGPAAQPEAFVVPS
jgi:anti-sigma B factor antagonist